MTIRELARKHGIEIGCIDNSCVFGPPGGMGTNGGCRCPHMRHVGRWTHDEQWEARGLVKMLTSLLSKVANDISGE